MIGNLKRIGITFSVVLAIGWCYSAFVVPLVEGGPQVKIDLPTNDVAGSSSNADKDLEVYWSLLPGESWEAKSRKRLRLDEGRVFFQDWQPLEDGRLEVKPFTLVFRESDEEGEGAEKPPLFLRTLEGAILEFDRPFQQGLGPSGKLLGATLKGEVNIFRPGIDEVSDLIDIRTTNIQIQEKRIFTPHRVDFRFGDHHGSGQNLVIQLLTDRHAGNDNVPKIRGIESLELVRVDQLALAVPEDDAELAPGKQDKKREPSHIHVNCAGSFLLDMVHQTARFQQDVQVSHRDDATQRELESLTCRTLTVEFDTHQMQRNVGPLPPPSRAAKLTTNELEDDDQDLEVKRLIAVGVPAVLHSDEREFHAESEYLSYDPRSRRISMRDKNKVLLMHKDLRFEAPSFEYTMGEDDGLGIATSVGAGRIFRVPGPDHAGLDITWQEELQLRPHEGLHALSLYGQPRLLMGGEGQFTANELHLWLAERQDVTAVEPIATANSLQPAGTTSHNAASADAISDKIDPVKLLAQGQVVIDSPKLGGTTERLEVFWDQVDTRVTNAPAANSAGGPSTTDRGNTQTGSTSSANLLPNEDESPPKQKLHVFGDFIRARLIQGSESFAIQEITIDGGARLVEEPLEDPTQSPLTISGKRLQVNALGEDLYAAYVVSEDAAVDTETLTIPTLSARGMELYGSELQLNQSHHRMWMEGKGEARIHSQPGSSDKADLTGPVIVRWQGGLDFDGQLVRVRDNVVIWLQTRNKDGNLSTVQLQGERLDIRLTQRINLAATSEEQSAEKAEVETLILGGTVLIQHWEQAMDGQWRAVDKLTANGAGIDYQTGNLLAGGPGVAQSIRIKSTMEALPGASLTKTDGDSDGKGLTHARIEFAKSIEGNLFEKRMAFVEQVQVFSDDVLRWDDWLEREQLQQSPTMVYLRCDRLQMDEVIATREAPASWLIQAIGNSYLTGRGMEATASRMTYEQAKDLLSLSADGRDDAQLSWQRDPGAPRDHARAREIKYWRTLNQIEVDGVTSISSGGRVGQRPSNGSPGGLPNRR